MQPHFHETIQQILEKHPVRQAYLFGSRSRGTEGPLSDIDVAVLFDEHVDADHEENQLYIALSRALCTDHIDLVNIATAPPLLAHRSVILGTPLLRHSRHEEAVLKKSILHAYEDTRFIRDIKQKAFL